MTNQPCIPNYFVGVLPIEFEYLGNIIMQREKLIAMRTIEKDEKYQDTPQELPKKNQQTQMPLLKIRKRNKKYQKKKLSRSNNEYQKRKLRKKNKTSSCIT